jgi:hypothetical protein
MDLRLLADGPGWRPPPRNPPDELSALRYSPAETTKMAIRHPSTHSATSPCYLPAPLPTSPTACHAIPTPGSQVLREPVRGPVRFSSARVSHLVQPPVPWHRRAPTNRIISQLTAAERAWQVARRFAPWQNGRGKLPDALRRGRTGAASCQTLCAAAERARQVARRFAPRQNGRGKLPDALHLGRTGVASCQTLCTLAERARQVARRFAPRQNTSEPCTGSRDTPGRRFRTVTSRRGATAPRLLFVPRLVDASRTPSRRPHFPRQVVQACHRERGRQEVRAGRERIVVLRHCGLLGV